VAIGPLELGYRSLLAGQTRRFDWPEWGPGTNADDGPARSPTCARITTGLQCKRVFFVDGKRVVCG